jgi:hypothetical protein
MSIVNLSKRYTYAGKLYGPGPTEIENEDVAKALSAKEQVSAPKPAAKQSEPEPIIKDKPLSFYDGKDRDALIAMKGIGEVTADDARRPRQAGRQVRPS